MNRLCSTVGLALTLICFGIPAASASEYCVVCYSPDARYRCMTNEGIDGPGKDQRAELQCISQIARSGKHESCSIDKASVAPCLGVVSFVDVGSMDAAPPNSALPSGQTGAPAQSQGAGRSTAGPANEPQPVAPSDAPAGAGGEPGIIEKSKQSMEKAGNAIGDAAKKSWDCMSSLFKRC